MTRSAAYSANRFAAMEQMDRMVGAINEAAYPWRDGSLERAFQSIDDDAFHLYVAEDASVVGVHDCDGDAGVFFVATLPDARGRGLAAGLMGVALEEARERGCDV